MLLGKQLRQRLREPEILVAAGAHDSLGARVFEQVGFQAIYMTGNGVSASVLGAPDIGLLTMSEMARTAANMQGAVRIPVIADADTGYGNVNNVARTVREYEHTGVAAIQLEDQVTPKRCGAMAGVAVIPRDEAVEKIRAAVAARRDVDAMLIIGRSDARKVAGFDEALERGKAFAAAGADIIFLEMLQSEEELRMAAKNIDAPIMFNALEGKTPPLSAAQLQNIGVKLLCYPLSSTLAYTSMLATLGRGLQAEGTDQRNVAQVSVDDYESLLGIARYA